MDDQEFCFFRRVGVAGRCGHSIVSGRSYTGHGSASVGGQLQLLCLARLRAIVQFSAPLFCGGLSRCSSLPILGSLLLLGRPPGLLALLGLALTGIGCGRNKFAERELQARRKDQGNPRALEINQVVALSVPDVGGQTPTTRCTGEGCGPWDHPTPGGTTTRP
jgi:hypothetical protein